MWGCAGRPAEDVARRRFRSARRGPSQGEEGRTPLVQNIHDSSSRADGHPHDRSEGPQGERARPSCSRQQSTLPVSGPQHQPRLRAPKHQSVIGIPDSRPPILPHPRRPSEGAQRPRLKSPVLLTEIPHPRGFAETGGAPLRLAVSDHTSSREPLPFMLTREDDIDVHALRRQGWTITAITAIARHLGSPTTRPSRRGFLTAQRGPRAPHPPGRRCSRRREWR